MGQYYGLFNQTRHQKVSSYWKGVPPSIVELKEIMSTWGWAEDDIIVAACYSKSFVYRDGAWAPPTEDLIETLNEELDKAEWTLTGKRPDLPFAPTFFCG